MNAGAAAAAEKRRQEHMEEEDMAGYSQEDLEGWEFKIVRSTMGKFSNPNAIRQVCEQEARAGWEMLEKFDNSRIRFKRRVEKRRSDSSLGYDPYRTNYGIGEGGLAIAIVGALIAIILTVLLVQR